MSRNLGPAPESGCLSPLEINPSLGPGDDWTAAIQTAHDQLFTAYGSGVVVLPAYPIQMGEVIYDSNMAFSSCTGAPESAIIVALPNQAAGFKSRDFDTLVGLGSNNGVEQTKFVGIKFQGNKGTGASASGSGISHYGTAQHVIGCGFYQFEEHGYFSEWGPGNPYGPNGGGPGIPGGGPAGHPLENYLANIVCWDNDASQMTVFGPHDSVAVGIRLVAQHVTGGPTPGHYGLNVGGGGGGFQMTNGHFWGGDAEHAFNLAVGACRVDNLVAEGAFDAQCRIASSGGVVMTNFHFFGQNGPQQKGLLLANCGNASIVGGKIGDGLPAGCIDFTGDNGGNMIHCNAFNSGGNPIIVGGPRNSRTTVNIMSDLTGQPDRGEVSVASANQRLGIFADNPATWSQKTVLPIGATPANIEAWIRAHEGAD